MKERIFVSFLKGKKTVLWAALFLLGLLYICIGNEVSFKAAFVESVEDAKPAFDAGVPVVFGCDGDYVPYLGVSLRSLIDNSDMRRSYDIWVLDGGIREKDKKIIGNMIKGRKNFSIRFFDIKPFISENEKKLYLFHKHISAATYYRLFIPRIFSAYRKMVYLDSDIIVNADIAKLYDINLEGRILGAARDIPNIRSGAARSVNGNRQNEYFSAGVLLLDVKRMRENDITDKSLQLLSRKIKEKRRREFYEDQDLLNEICLGNVKIIDEKWNLFNRYCYEERSGETKNAAGKKMQVRVFFEKTQANIAADFRHMKEKKLTSTPFFFGRRSKVYDIPAVIHYAGAKKPWKEEVRCGNIWWEYAEKSPFYSDIIEKYKKVREIASHPGLFIDNRLKLK
ncbi:MAG: glycosyltransferase family 8 protein [Holosporaceae bacterium]|nr:glycosyltransferase family 8 protein [Holosporaceae bacterium]